LPVGDHLGQIRSPAGFQRFIGDVFLDCADGDRAEPVVQGAGAFAQPVLRADPAADFRQRVGAMGHFGGFEQLPSAISCSQLGM
jgi:hypothetical protein